MVEPIPRTGTWCALVRAAVLLWLALLPGVLPAQTPAAPPAPAATGAAGLSAERLERLGEVLETYIADGRLPGAVVLVAREGRVAYLEAFGWRDLEARDALETNDIFRIASQTKALVTTAVLMLQEEGRLLISHPLARYLPEFARTTVAVPDDDGGYDVVAVERPITLRDLLTHTAGIGYGYGPARERWAAAGIQGWYFADRDEPIRATVRRMADLPFDAQPGERWVYGYATDILGAVVEVVSGMPLDAFLRTRILEPLGMTDTHFYLPPAERERLAVVYSLDDEGRLTRAPDPGGMVGQGAYVDGPHASFSGGAGLLSTARDYGRFLQMLLNGGALDGVRILSPKTVELMTVNHVGGLFAAAGSPGTGFGLGFSVVEDLGARGVPGSVGEFGWGGAYHSVYWVDPAEELVVVYLTQVIPAGRLDDHARVRALVYQALLDDAPVRE
ncbi:MAG TPA: serine hydrolase domain-containing protein [Gemmatimonadota bacterium]|nr:serine hydrolase domain-containing protein [Gemmatimonadota bacterium]